MSAKGPSESSAFYLSCLLAVAGVLSAGNPARAETSIKKIERKLRKLEKGTGKVLQFTGKVALIGAFICAEALLESADDSHDSGDYRTKHPPTNPEASNSENRSTVPASGSTTPRHTP
jgi:hypothetical protein